jgi:hypothetical protein
MADNFGSSFSDAFAQQQKIGIADRAQQFQEEAARKAQAEGHIKQLMDVAAKITQAAAESGKDPMTVAGAIQPLVDSAAQVASSTYGPEGAARVQGMARALLARPAGIQDNSFSGHVVSAPTVENPLGQGVMILNKRTGATEVRPVGVVPGPQSAVPPNTQMAALDPSQTVNLGDKEVTGVSVTDIPPGAPPVPSSAPVNVAQVDQPGVGVAGLSSDAIELRARQFIDGNEMALKNLPRSRAGMAVMNAIINRASDIAKEKGLSAEEVNARAQKFKATTAGAQILGKREGTLAGAIANVQATAPIVAELSSQIDRTQFPLINKIIIAGREQTGDPKIIRLGIALNTATTNYARAQGGGNSQLTDTARHEAQQLLQMAYSDGQLQAGVDQLLIEMQREKYQVGRAIDDYLKLRTEAIKQSVPQSPPSFITPGGVKFKVLQ